DFPFAFGNAYGEEGLDVFPRAGETNAARPDAQQHRNIGVERWLQDRTRPSRAIISGYRSTGSSQSDHVHRLRRRGFSRSVAGLKCRPTRSGSAGFEHALLDSDAGVSAATRWPGKSAHSAATKEAASGNSSRPTECLI